MKIYMRFYECEHQGDLNAYFADLRSSGAEILDSRLDSGAEEGAVKIEVEDFPAFKAAFQKTDSADFADSLDWLEVPNA